MNGRRVVIFILIALVAIGAIVWFFYQRGSEGGLVASGTIEGTEVTVSSKVVAKVLEVKVDEGSQVKEGDVLAVLDARDFQQNLKSAQAKYKIARDDYERSKQLFRDKMISPQQYDMAASAVDVASAALETAKIQLENTTIKAPLSGVILVKAIEPGELATIASPIATMADLSSVDLTVYLPEKDIGKVKLGEEVSIAVDSYPDEKFTGKIKYISEKAEFTPKAIQTKEERVTQVFAIKIKISNPEMKLKPGMPADAEFKWTSQ